MCGVFSMSNLIAVKDKGVDYAAFVVPVLYTRAAGWWMDDSEQQKATAHNHNHRTHTLENTTPRRLCRQ